MIKRTMATLVCSAASVLATVDPLVAQNVPTGQQQPNVVFILADDLGWSTLGAYGSTIVSTPNIDRLAAQGMKFNRAYVTPQCTPTRASLFTGQYTARNGMWHVVGSYHYPHMRLREPVHVEGLPRTTYILPKVMRDASYQTGLVGKWHLHNWTDGHYDGLFEPFRDVHGFDSVFPHYEGMKRSSGGSPDKGVEQHTEAAVRFISQTKKPYFLWIGYHPVHGPSNAPQELVQKYVDKGYPSDRKAINSAYYLAMVENLDLAVGRIQEAINASGATENTIIVFMSDNGGVSTSYSNAPLRQGKGSPYEGGLRVPMIVSWPGTVAAGSVCDVPVHAVDIYPTLTELASARVPSEHVLDGVSLVPLLRSQDTAWQRGQPLFFFQPLYDVGFSATPNAAIIDGDWKLIEFFGDYVDIDDNKRYIPSARVELYNLKVDIGEQRNLAELEPAKHRQMQQQLYRWLEHNQVQLPMHNPQYDPDKLWQRRGGQWMSPDPHATRSRTQDLLGKETVKNAADRQ